ncbi:MAG TPA: fused MFS/spermidine synthase [Caulobacteraceae bacterium]|nr:fused MFS/spermidine synthase [Caulobacteraceae bacterium]
MTATADTRVMGLGAFTPALFVVTVFASAALVFMVEPMIAKLVLPRLGGSAAVWNTSLAFFQAALLAGYVYAHLLQRIGSTRVQIGLHVAVLILAALVLPLKVSGVLGDPPPDAPALWLVGVLTLSIGAPFAALSATAPLVQAWHARTYREDEAREPYALYAASNLGSLLALLSYPVLVEPGLTLRGQTLGWSGGYGLFVVLMGLLGLMLWRRATSPVAVETTAAPAAPVAWRARAFWIGLAAIPSSLMLGVTTYVTTDLGSAPFLWVAPLALYLATFIIAFQTRPLIPRKWTLVIQAVAIAIAAAFMHFWSGGFIQELAVHLTAFFFTALMCHQALVARRPPPAQLTDFYICISLGGVIGGAFNAFAAPVLFNSVLEYPLVVVISCLARPWGEGNLGPWRWTAMAIGLISAVIAVAITHPPEPIQRFIWGLTENLEPARLAAPFLALSAVAAFLLRGRALVFMSAILVLTIASNRVGDRVDVAHSWRSFFGVVRTSRMQVTRLGGEVRMLSHGTTLHGAQAPTGPYRCLPLLYYAHETPIGQVFDAERRRKPAVSIGAIGLGTGSVAAYVRPSDNLTFFEIDPLVFRISTNPANFSYTTQCAPKGRIGYVLGDARLTLNRQPAHRFDILLIDAFSSDSVPAHLLTVEAARMYLSKLKPDGVVILHLSNRNLDLIAPAESVAAAAGGYALVQHHDADKTKPPLWESAEDVVILSPTQIGLAPYKDDIRWDPIRPGRVRAWTDDYTNLFGALIRRTKEKLGAGTD